MIKAKYDFRKCMFDRQFSNVALPEDINSLMIGILKEIGSEDYIQDIKHIQKEGLYGEMKVVNSKVPHIMYVFKYQSGMILTWDSVTTINRESGPCEITFTHKNDLIKIEKRKRQDNGHSENNAND